MLVYYSKFPLPPHPQTEHIVNFYWNTNMDLGSSFVEEKAWKLALKAKWDTAVNITKDIAMFALGIITLDISFLPSTDFLYDSYLF